MGNNKIKLHVEYNDKNEPRLMTENGDEIDMIKSLTVIDEAKEARRIMVELIDTNIIGGRERK